MSEKDPKTDSVSISRRKLLGSVAAIGGAGAIGAGGTSALFWDEEVFGTVDTPNVLQAGALDLKVDWDVRYYDGIDSTAPADDSQTGGTIDSTSMDNQPEGDVMVDQPGPLVQLQDIKPGDVIEKTLSLHLYDNPGFVSIAGDITTDSDTGITEPEDKVNGHEADDSDGDPFSTSGLLGTGLVAGTGLSSLRSQSESEEEGDGNAGSTMRKAAFAAGAAAAGIAGLSGSATADHAAQETVQISNSDLEVNVGALHSGGGIGEEDWFFNGVSTLYRETYGFQDGNSDTHQNAEDQGSIIDSFPASANSGDSVEATVEFPNFENANGESTPLEVVRRVTLDPNEATLRVEYDVTNTSGSASIDDLRISQYVDYDIDDISGDFGKYFLDDTTDCEYIWLKDVGTGLFAGFTGETLSSNHSLTEYSDGLSEFEAVNPEYSTEGGIGNVDRFPSSGEDDVELTFEWSLGQLGPGETTTFRNSFVYNTNEDDFQTELCQESPGEDPEPEPDDGDGELDNLMECVVWYDGNDAGEETGGDNFPEEILPAEHGYSPGGDDFLLDLTNGDIQFEDNENLLFQGSLREMLDSVEGGQLLGPAGSTPEAFPDSSCFDNSTTHYIGVLCWVPRDIPGYNDNIIQTDTVEYYFGFNAIQCRHNVDDDGSPIVGTIADADAENNAFVDGGE